MVNSGSSVDCDSLPLGRTTEFTANVSQRQKRKSDKPKPRYDLLTAAQELLPFERVNICHKNHKKDSTHIKVIHNPEFGTARYEGLMKCRSVWSCPICAAKITEERRKELRTGLSNCTNRLVLVTYTLRHQWDDPLKFLLEGLKMAFAKMRTGRPWQDVKHYFGIVGAILTTEVTYGRHGWHAHRHELMLLPDDISDEMLLALDQKLRERWIWALEQVGMSADWVHGLDMNIDPKLNREYIAKFGRDPALDEWTVAHEMTKNTFKEGKEKGRTPWQLLSDYVHKGDLDAGILFQEYVYAFKNSHQLHWSKHLRKYLGMGEEIKDEDLNIDETEITEVELYEINLEVWRVICKLQIRGQLLEIAGVGDAKKLETWIERKTGLKTVRIDLTQIC